MLNFDIVSAANGEEALSRFMCCPRDYKLIFMDIQMPIMNGYDAALRIREYEEQVGIETPCYIVGLSGEDTSMYERRCR